MNDFTFQQAGQKGGLETLLVSLMWLGIGILGLVILGFILRWLFYRHKQRLIFLQNRDIPSIISELRGQDFEVWIKELCLSLGIKAKVVGGSGDHGIDLIAEYQGKKIGIQCKKYWGDKLVSESQVRDLYGAQRHGGFDKALLITTGNFSYPAINWAKGKSDLELVNGYALSRIVLNRDLLRKYLT